MVRPYALLSFISLHKQPIKVLIFLDMDHCVKSVQIKSFSGPYFPLFGLRKSPYLVRIQQNTDQEKHCIWTLFTQVVLGAKLS